MSESYLIGECDLDARLDPAFIAVVLLYMLESSEYCSCDAS